MDEEAILEQLKKCEGEGKPIRLRPTKLWIVLQEGESFDTLVETARKIITSYD